MVINWNHLFRYVCSILQMTESFWLEDLQCCFFEPPATSDVLLILWSHPMLWQTYRNYLHRNPNDPCFYWIRPCFGGLKLKNTGQTDCRYVLPLFPAVIETNLDLCVLHDLLTPNVGLVINNPSNGHVFTITKMSQNCQVHMITIVIFPRLPNTLGWKHLGPKNIHRLRGYLED